MKLLVIGASLAVWGFSLAGIDGQVVTSENELTAALDGALKDPDIGIVLITSNAADFARERIRNLMSRSELPLIVEIMGPEGPSADRLSMSEMLRRTIGVRL